MDTLPEVLGKELKDLVREMFNWLMQPCLGRCLVSFLDSAIYI